LRKGPLQKKWRTTIINKGEIKWGAQRRPLIGP